jgi:hypothetical protein
MMCQNIQLLIMRFCKFYRVVFFTWLSISVQAQSDSIVSPKGDTVFIIHEPVVIRQPVMAEKIVVEKVKAKKFFVEGSYQRFQVYDYYDVCEDCPEFRDKLNNSTSSLAGYNGAVGIGYKSTKIISMVTVGVSSYYNKLQRNKVNTTYEGVTINEFRYWNVNLNVGYQYSFRAFSIIPLVEFAAHHKYKITGETINSAKPDSLEDINKGRLYNTNLLSVGAGIRLVYLFKGIVGVFAEPHYTGDISSTTHLNDIFTQQRSTLGIKAGVMCFVR